MQSKRSFREEALSVEPMLKAYPLIRAANFHNTPRYRSEEIEQQIKEWSRDFSSVDEHELDDYLASGRWGKTKPGLIVAMYNGYRNGYDVMRPLLERYGFVGWFFVATAFVNTPAAEQKDFVTTRTLKIIKDEYSDGRYALNWEELKVLDRHHVVASHTRNHSQLLKEDTEGLAGETIGPQKDFETHLGHRVSAFASLSGAPYGEHAASDALIEAAQYRFVFSNYKIQRIRNASGKIHSVAEGRSK